MVYWLAIFLGGAALCAVIVWRHSRRPYGQDAAARRAHTWHGLPDAVPMPLQWPRAVARSVRQSMETFFEAVAGSSARVTEAVVASGARMSEAARFSRSTMRDAFKIVWLTIGGRRGSADLANAFRNWLVKARPGDRKDLFRGLPDDAGEFSDWLANLPNEQLEVFTQHVAATLAEWNIDLAWVVKQNMSHVPALERVVERSVMLHCVACWLAGRVQDDIRAFATFQAWQRDPYSERQKKVNQRLYSRLVERGLLTSPAADVLLASETKRHDYVVNALRQVSAADAEAFSAALQEVAASEQDDYGPSGMPAEPAPAPEQPVAPRRRLRIPVRGSADGHGHPGVRQDG